METRQLSYTEAFLLIADLWDHPRNIGARGDEAYILIDVAERPWDSLLRRFGICDCIYALYKNKSISKETAQKMLKAVSRAKPEHAHPDAFYWPTTAEGAIKRASVCREAAAWLPIECFS